MQCIDTLTMKKLKILDLFSGIGGFSLGLEATGGFETSAFCDIDPYCRKVLQQHWPNVPIYEDIKKLKGTDIGTVDIITGGYPCQPFSVAGKQKGVEDKRHLWPEYFRLIKECRPTWVIGENVSGHIKLGLDSVIEDLESEDYSTRTFSISASSIGANHKRERIWIVAYTRQPFRRVEPTWDKESLRRGTFEETKWSTNTNTTSRSSEGTEIMANSIKFGLEKHGHSKTTESIKRNQTVADSNSHTKTKRGECSSDEKTSPSRKHNEGRSNGNGGEGCISSTRENSCNVTNSNSKRQQEQWRKSIECGNWWKTEPNVGRVVNGVPNRVDRLKALGNSLIPQIPFYIGQTILRTYENNDSV